MSTKLYNMHMRTESIAYISTALDKFANAFGVSVNEGDRNYWINTTRILKTFDDLVDDERIYDVLPYVERVIAGQEIPNLSKTYSEQFSKMYQGLEPYRQDRFIKAAELGNIAIKRCNSQSIDEYIDIILDESILCSDLLKMSDRGTDKEQRCSFNKWLTLAGRAGYILDTIADMKKDYNEGLVRIKPSAGVYKSLAAAAIKESYCCIKGASAASKIEMCKCAMRLYHSAFIDKSKTDNPNHETPSTLAK
jgi:hypothetical protein